MSAIYVEYGQVGVVAGIVRGLGAAVIALITIAVVGVIAALAVFVARNAAFVDGAPDWLVIVLALVAVAAIVRFKVGVVWVVASCAVVGLLASIAG